jgi:hypothetical protein
VLSPIGKAEHSTFPFLFSDSGCIPVEVKVIQFVKQLRGKTFIIQKPNLLFLLNSTKQEIAHYVSN